ncbi:MAG: RNA polymerase sigma factor [Gemmatimonadota bacterium]|nr:RNA polymerase sigma factor [Gemmatimonadota bacterium]
MDRSGQGSDDAALVLRAREGNAGAFEALVRKHYRGAFAVARSRVENAMDAEDVVQESFVRALERLDDCDPERFAGWFLTMVRNRAHNARIYERRRHGVDPEEAGLATGDEGDGGTGRRARISGLRDALEEAVATLPPVQREILLLHDLEGFKHAEIAETVGVSVGMSRYHLMQARRKMRDELDRDALEVQGHGS